MTCELLADELFVLVLSKMPQTGAVRGQPASCYDQGGPALAVSIPNRLNTLTQYSQELDRTVRAELLSLVTDLEGSSGGRLGLFLHPNERAGGLGLLLARSRYLFVGDVIDRKRFAERIIAELRGIIDERGGVALLGRGSRGGSSG